MAEEAEQPKAEVIRDRFNRAYNVLLAQRDASNEDVRFCDVDGAMWEDFFPNQFANRPKIEFNLVNETVYRTYAEWMQNRFRVKYLPDDSKASEDDAKVLNGLYRRDENHSNGFDAYDNAFSEMLKGGVGGWRLHTQFTNEEENLQEIVFSPVFNAYNSIVWDDNAKKYDKSDAKWCIILHEFSKEAYEEKYPNTPIESFGLPPFGDRSMFNWATKTRVFVAEYYEIVSKKEQVLVYRDVFGTERNVWASEIKDVIEELATMGYEQINEYTTNRQTVEKTVSSANQELEKTVRIAGKFIPVIPVYGFRSYVDGQEFFYGKVRKLKDGNRLFNMSISGYAETAATSMKRLPILLQDEVEGMESYWASAHLAKYPYLVKKPHITAQGIEQERVIQYLEPPTVDPNTQAVAQMASAFIQSKSGNNPEDVLDNSASGVSVREQAMRIEQPDGILFENMAKSQRRCGVVYRSMAADIYDGERFIMLLESDGLNNPVTLMDWVIDKEGKAKFLNDITKGEYKVVVDTGPAFATKRRETANLLKEIIQMAPQGAEEIPVLYSALIENIEGDGLEDLKKFVRRKQIMQGIKDPETDEEIQMVESAKAQQQQGQSMDRLIEATAQKETAEAMERASKAQVNVSTAKLNEAKSVQIASDMQLDKFKAGQAAINDQFERRQKQLPRLLQGL